MQPSEEGPAPVDSTAVWQLIEVAAHDIALVELRFALADLFAEVFASVGKELHIGGHIIGTDRKDGFSPFGHGSDETVAVSTLLRIAAQLLSGSVDLFRKGRVYAAAALLRQLVEVEYLAWAFDAKNSEAEKWLRSSKNEREKFFTPAKLRKAAAGKFRAQDYGYHCEFGGHPVPGAGLLLIGGEGISQLLLSDLLGHAGSIWDHLVRWGSDKQHGTPILARNEKVVTQFRIWKSKDPLVELPPPP